MDNKAHIFFHAPCFDGIVSAAIASELVAREKGWAQGELHPVGYEQRGAWLATALPQPAVVVDFLYHPMAAFWADHHRTAFLGSPATFLSRDGQDRIALYDPTADSCARVLLDGALCRHPDLLRRFWSWVHWADKIDSARYASVDEVLRAESPALAINAGLTLDHEKRTSVWLVDQVRRHSIEDVAALPRMAALIAQYRELASKGLERLREAARLEEDGVVVFDADESGGLISRYAPFYLFPDARYSAGLVRRACGVKVTAMRNPWIEFASAPIGKFCEELGGGGHQRVGSIVYRKEQVSRARDALRELIARIRRYAHQAESAS